MRSLVRVPVLGAVVLTLVSVSACSYMPDSVENRTRLPSCGEYETRNEPLSPDQLRNNRCILDALDQGRQAELIRTWYGDDGGPITEYVRVLGAGSVEMFVDATRYQRAGPEARWSRWLCRDLQETDGNSSGLAAERSRSKMRSRSKLAGCNRVRSFAGGNRRGRPGSPWRSSTAGSAASARPWTGSSRLFGSACSC